MDHLEEYAQHRFLKSLFFLIFLNLLVLDGMVGIIFLGKSDKQIIRAVIMPTAKPQEPNSTQVCPSGCLNAIKEAVSPFQLTPSPITQSKSTVLLQPTAVQTYLPISPVQIVDNAKEFFIPLGSGSSTATEWTDIPGVQAQIDSSKYANLQKILFEASVHVPNANEIVEVRLSNDSDNYIVDNSNFLYPSGSTDYFRIAAIQLGSGSKIYKVQMKTQLGYSAVLDQARIHITTN